MRNAIYAGSFDIFTNGHLWMIEQGSELFDHLYVIVSHNTDKKYLLDFEIRFELVNKVILSFGNGFKNVTILSGENKFIVDIAEKYQVNYLLRGLRSSIDFEYESQIDKINNYLSTGDPICKSVFLMAPEQNNFISSSMIKGLIGFNGWEKKIKNIIPSQVYDELIYKYSELADERHKVLCRKYSIVSNDINFIYESCGNAYHNFNHIKECIKEFIRIKKYLHKPDLVELAIYYHDSIYVAGAKDNEFKSAQFFRNITKSSTLTPKELEYIYILIQSTNWTNKGYINRVINNMTKSEQQEIVGDYYFLRDIDFSIFATPNFNRFLEYDKSIEEEYKNISKRDFIIGRNGFLKELNSKLIFMSNHFNENLAHENINKLLTLRYGD